MWQTTISPFESLNSPKNTRSPFVSLRRQITLSLRLQNTLQIDPRADITPKLSPSGLQNEPQSDTKSIKYQPLIHSKTDSDFRLLMTLTFHQFSLDLEAYMALTCVKCCLTSKHSSNIKHQNCIVFYQSNKASCIYISVKQVVLESLKPKSKQDLHW